MKKSYTAVNGHRAFVIGIVDWFSRKVMAYNEVNTTDAFHCVNTHKMAIKRFGKPEISNSDQGSQFTSSEFVGELRNYGVKISMDERGRCLDNAKMERFWWALKYEDIKSKSMSACRNCSSAFNIMSIFTIRSGFIRRYNIKPRMKSISVLVICKQKAMVIRRSLHRSFNRKLYSQGGGKRKFPGLVKRKFHLTFR